jgi:membrane protease YdiL (CAAX protease family)
MPIIISQPSRIFLALECGFLFVVLPLLISFHPARWLVASTLWGAVAYGTFILSHMPGFSWRQEGRGVALSPGDFKIIIIRLVLSTLAMIALTAHVDRSMLFAFPLQRPGVWAAIMLLYPLLSALPQELLFRSFFFRRYTPLFPGNVLLAVSAFAFSFGHILFHNPISLILSAICGLFLGWSYRRHASLKKVVLEHALYGDMVFTIGLGIYFVLRHI